MAATPTKRLSSAAKGYGHRWKKARAVWLGEHPYCADHARRGQHRVRAEVVDHIKPHRMAEALESGDSDRIAEARRLFWDRSNWQSLCRTCHDSYKQRVEKSGEPGCDLSGVPLRASHHWN